LQDCDRHCSCRTTVFSLQLIQSCLFHFFNKGSALGGSVRRVDVNGQPGAMFMDTTDRLIGVMELDIVDGAVQSVRTIVNPDKLQHLGPVSDILRRDSNPES